MKGDILSFLLGIAFSAGIFYEASRRFRKDLTGVRKLLNHEIDRTRARYIHTIVVLLTQCKQEDMRAVLDLLKRDVE